MRPRNRTINLYWVTTDDHSEDWFIFAASRTAAAAYFEEFEGYNDHDASARMIVANPHRVPYLSVRPPCKAEIDDLETLGFQSVGDTPLQRIVRYKGETFAEGFMEALIMEGHDNSFEAMGKGRPNRTKRTSTRRN